MDARQGAGGFPLYVPSGKTPILGLLFGSAAGAASALILAVIYAYGTIYIPIVQVEFLLTLVFGAAIGGVTGGVMHLFKVRNALIIGLLGFALGAFGWAFSWLPWLYAVFHRADVPLGVLDVVNPLFLIDALPNIYQTGTWSIGRSATENVSGLMLGFVWLLEAGIIIAASTLTSLMIGVGRAFCEKCETWCTVLEGQAVYDADAADSIGQALTVRGDLTPLASSPPPTSPDRWASLTLGFCGRCGETNVVGLDIVAEVPNGKGGRERTNTHHTPFVCISRDQMTWLRNGLSQQHANVAPPQPGAR